MYIYKLTYVCVGVRICAYAYARSLARMYVCMYVHTYARIHVCMHVRMYLCMCVHIYVCAYTHLGMYARAHARTYACVTVLKLLMEPEIKSRKAVGLLFSAALCLLL